MSTSIESVMYPTLNVFMNASWDANASLANGSLLAHLNHMGMAYRRNFWMSTSESRMIWTALDLVLVPGRDVLFLDVGVVVPRVPARRGDHHLLDVLR